MADKEISLRDYWNMLNRHDWYYENSDDGRVWRAGQRSLDQLEKLAAEKEERKALLEEFIAYYNSRLDSQAIQIPKPPCP